VTEAQESPPTPSVDEIGRIVAIESPVVRNLEITYCYSRLAAAVAARIGEGANWCTYATWASRQAGGTIRGEDLLAQLERKLLEGRWLLHPLATLWRKLLRRGLFDHETRLGRLTGELHTPFDAFELASDAVARGNLKVFEEIGLQFARYLEADSGMKDFLAGLRPGEPPDGQRLLRQAFTHYEQARLEHDPARHAELALLANLEIGLHEQRRLQPKILKALDAASSTQEDLGRRALEALFPSATGWWPVFRGPAAALLSVPARALQRAASRLAREAITDALMVLSLPGRVLSLAANLGDTYPPELVAPVDPDLVALLGRFEPVPPALDDCGVRDWSDFHERMHYIVHLFRAFHLSRQLFDAPFTASQIESLGRGVIPDGEL
jgi:hypothetical protein